MLRMPSAVATAIDLTSLPAEVAALIERLQQQAKADAQELARRGGELTLAQAKIDKLNFELARLRRWQFDAKTEAMTAAQRLLFAEALAEDEASLRAKLAELQRGLPEAPKTPKAPPRKPRRQALPAHLARVEHRHEPEDTHCPNADCRQPMQRIGEDVSEKLDIVPAKFFVHRHIYGKWACWCCQQLHQEPAEPDVVDGGIPAAGLVAHTLISRFVDHLPYYRQEPINARSGVHTPRSTLSSWGGAGGASLEPLYELHRAFILGCRVLHADETPVPLLDPGAGKTKKAYRSGENVRDFLQLETPNAWKGTLVTDGFSGYSACVDKGVTSAQCMAHSRRKFHELWANHGSQVSEQALRFYQALFRIERQAEQINSDERRRLRQRKSRRVLALFYRWLLGQRQLVPPGSATIKAIDYSLKRWKELTHFVNDGDVPISNNWVENQIRPIAVGRSNWLFAGSLRAGKRAAAIMSLLHSARINGHDPYAYFKDVLDRLPTHPATRIDELLPHRWSPS